ncbi:hypothetical protein NIES4073_03050 (plasmid) [Kalymmatonema gypsitolerans NIES-4073]|nr:hypothetical protein NIES4073_03050 [Scytonema sp. NIES-4073]
MLASPMLEVGNYPNCTDLTLVHLFNNLVLEQGTSYTFPGRYLTLASNVVRLRTQAGQMGFFKPPDLSVGFLTLLVHALAIKRGLSDCPV